MTGLATDAGVSPSYFTRVLRLSFLAPDIAMPILDGRRPINLFAKQFLGMSDLPAD